MSHVERLLEKGIPADLYELVVATRKDLAFREKILAAAFNRQGDEMVGRVPNEILEDIKEVTRKVNHLNRDSKTFIGPASDKIRELLK